MCNDFTAEVDGEVIYLFTEAGYEQPFEVEFLKDDPSFEHNEYFGYIAFKLIGTRPFSGTVTKIPLYETVTLNELHLYGSSRLGMKAPNLPVGKQRVEYTYTNNYGNGVYLVVLDGREEVLTNPAAGPFFEHNKGLKQYELSNHLGNVLVVFSDKKVSHEGSAGAVGHYTVSLLNVQDYFPFGWTMPGRKYNSPDYRFGFNGMEKDDDVKGEGNSYDFGARIYDNRISKWLSPDPLFGEQPGWSPYKAFLCNPLMFKDPDGRKEHIVTQTYDARTGETTIEYSTAPRVMTDGKNHRKDQGWFDPVYYNYFYDFNTIKYVFIDADGNSTTLNSKSEIVYENGVKGSSLIWTDGEDYGYTKGESNGFKGGIHLTWSMGKGGETRYSVGDVDHVDIDMLMGALASLNRSSSANLDTWKTLQSLKGFSFMQKYLEYSLQTASAMNFLMGSYDVGGDLYNIKGEMERKLNPTAAPEPGDTVKCSMCEGFVIQDAPGRNHVNPSNENVKNEVD